MDEGFLILTIVAIVAIILAAGLFISSSENIDDVFDFKSPITIDVISNDSLSNGDELLLRLSQDNVALANKTINITFVDANSQTDTFNLTTDDQGIAKVIITNVTPGNYTISCVYGDYGVYLSSLTFDLNVRESYYI